MRVRLCLLGGWLLLSTPLVNAADIFNTSTPQLAAQLAEDRSQLEARDAQGNTPLLAAAQQNDLPRVKWLLAQGADVNAMNSARRDILNIAISVANPALVATALNAGADPTTVTSVYEGSALIYASHQAQVETVALLIDAGAPLNRINNLGWTALLEASILGDGSEKYAEIVRLLLEAGADKNIADRNGLTPLDHARKRGHKALVQLLAE